MKKYLRIASMFGVMFGLMSVSHQAFAFTEGACKDDMKKYCGDVKPGDGGMRDCMKAHEADFSQACKDNIAEGKAKFEAKRKEIETACKADIKQYCANVTPGEGRDIACLKSYDDKISAGCKAALPKMGMHKKGMHHGDKDAKGGAPTGDDGPPPPPEGK